MSLVLVYNWKLQSLSCPEDGSTCTSIIHGYWGNEFHEAEEETAPSEKEEPLRDALELGLPIMTL